jgi:hypothetical protein
VGEEVEVVAIVEVMVVAEVEAMVGEEAMVVGEGVEVIVEETVEEIALLVKNGKADCPCDDLTHPL